MELLLHWAPALILALVGGLYGEFLSARARRERASAEGTGPGTKALIR
jgi:hypothetical protein